MAGQMVGQMNRTDLTAPYDAHIIQMDSERNAIVDNPQF